MDGPKGTNLVKGIILRDDYFVRDLPKDSFDYVFDIGANIGVFCLQARVLFPSAKVVAVEPRRDLFELLQKNMNMLDVICDNSALGNGQVLKFGHRGHPLDSLIVPDDWKGEISEIPTLTLPQLFKKYGCRLTHKYMLKFDCEGGEAYLVGDRKAEKIMKHSKQVGIEVHFPSTFTPFDHWLPWEKYDKWLHDIMDETHFVKCVAYHPKRGYAIYHIPGEKYLDDPKARIEIYKDDPADLYTQKFIYGRTGKKRRIGMKLGGSLIHFFGDETFVDFGCSIGSYLEGALAGGAKKVLGFDVIVDKAQRYIPDGIRPYLKYAHVGKQVRCGKWDCAISIEVAEHLLPEEADTFVQNLVNASEKHIVFTASPKKGYYHFNTQPQQYWINLFETRGFTYSFILTEKLKELWKTLRAEPWVLRNLMVFQKKRNEKLPA